MSDHRRADGARTGSNAFQLARKHGALEALPYNWKGNYGCMKIFEAKRQKKSEDENAKFKKLPAEQVLYAAAPGEF